jgi:NAD(P)-dependent dehydrogenase (short-subunit alcohol dehydrogenase family)
MDYDLDGWVVLVSGAASGISHATAEVLAGMGPWIVAADIDADAGEAAAAALRDGGAEVRFVTADVAGGAMVAAALDAFGRLDGAANCAGVGAGHAETHDYPIDVWDRIVAISLRGTWLATRAILAHGDGGAIVNVASTPGLRGCRTPRPAARAGTASSASCGRPRSRTPSAVSASTPSARARSTRR